MLFDCIQRLQVGSTCPLMSKLMLLRPPKKSSDRTFNKRYHNYGKDDVRNYVSILIRKSIDITIIDRI